MEGLSTLAHIAANNPSDAAAALARDGVVAIDGLVPPSVIDDLRAHILARHPEFADKALLSDFQDNGSGRFISRIIIDDALIDSGLLIHPALDALACAALGEDWVIEAVGMLMAFPGCAEQKPHRDGGPLFPQTPLGAILPAYALSIIIPLVDVAANGGTTAFRPGSHGYARGGEGDEPVTTELARGGALVWNFETIHWGVANTGERARPALYLTLCRPFWTDACNFGGTMRIRLQVEDAVVPRLDRRFARAAGSGRWAHDGLGEALPPVVRTP